MPLCIQCFDAVGWVAATVLNILSRVNTSN